MIKPGISSANSVLGYMITYYENVHIIVLRVNLNENSVDLNYTQRFS